MPDDPYAVLAELVELHDNVGIGIPGRRERYAAAFDAARALLAAHRDPCPLCEHPTKEHNLLGCEREYCSCGRPSDAVEETA